MFTSTEFTFDGITGEDYGLMLGNLTTGADQQPFGVSRSIVEEKIPGKEQAYFYHFDYEPLRFVATFVREKEWSMHDRRQIAKWFFQREYKPFVSLDDTGIIYNCMVVDNPEKIMVGNIQRMIQLNFQCDAPWAWSANSFSNFDLSTNPGTSPVVITNQSNVVDWYKPQITIQKRNGPGDITLTNLADGNREFQLTGLLDDEIILVNNEIQQILSNLPNRYPLNHFNRKWARLRQGENIINVQGDCEISFMCKFPIGV